MTQKVHFAWDIHYRCNYRCPFCWFHDKWGQMERLNRYEPLEKVVALWRKMFERYGECHVMISGGEPSIYPGFVELIERISAFHTVKITSQLSGDMHAFARRIDPSRVCLDINFHPAEARFEPLLDKVLSLKQHGFKCDVCYLAYPPQMEMIDHYQREFAHYGIGFALAAFWGEHDGKRYPGAYSEAERAVIGRYLGDIDRIVHHLEGRRTKGRLCRSGCRYASIKADGTVTRCGPLSHLPIGNFFDESFALFERPMPCEADVCPNDEYVWLVPYPAGGEDPR